MNTEDLLNEAESAMLDCTDHSAFRYCLFLHTGELLCRPALLTPKEAIHIAQLTRQHLEDGLTSDQWNSVAQKMVTIYKELNLCPQPQKP